MTTGGARIRPSPKLSSQVYRFWSTKDARVITGSFGLPNAIRFLPDHKMVYITDSPETNDEAKEDVLPTPLYIDLNPRNSVCGFGVGLPLPSYVFDAIKLYSVLLNLISVKVKSVRIIDTGWYTNVYIQMWYSWEL